MCGGRPRGVDAGAVRQKRPYARGGSCEVGFGVTGGRAGLDCLGLAMAPLLPPAMAPRVPAPLLSVSESGRRRRPSARSRRLLLLSSSAAAILARQELRGPRGRRQAEPAQAAQGERPGGESGGASPGDTPSPPPLPRRSRARHPGELQRRPGKGTLARGGERLEAAAGPGQAAASPPPPPPKQWPQQPGLFLKGQVSSLPPRGHTPISARGEGPPGTVDSGDRFGPPGPWRSCPSSGGRGVCVGLGWAVELAGAMCPSLYQEGPRARALHDAAAGCEV